MNAENITGRLASDDERLDWLQVAVLAEDEDYDGPSWLEVGRPGRERRVLTTFSRAQICTPRGSAAIICNAR